MRFMRCCGSRERRHSTAPAPCALLMPRQVCLAPPAHSSALFCFVRVPRHTGKMDVRMRIQVPADLLHTPTKLTVFNLCLVAFEQTTEHVSAAFFMMARPTVPPRSCKLPLDSMLQLPPCTSGAHFIATHPCAPIMAGVLWILSTPRPNLRWSL